MRRKAGFILRSGSILRFNGCPAGAERDRLSIENDIPRARSMGCEAI